MIERSCPDAPAPDAPSKTARLDLNAKSALLVAVGSLLSTMAGAAIGAARSANPSSGRAGLVARNAKVTGARIHPMACTELTNCYTSTGSCGASGCNVSAVVSFAACNDNGCIVIAKAPATNGVIYIEPTEVSNTEPIRLDPIGNGSGAHIPTNAQKVEAINCAEKYGVLPNGQKEKWNTAYKAVYNGTWGWVTVDTAGNVTAVDPTDYPNKPNESGTWVAAGALTGSWPLSSSSGTLETIFYQQCYNNMNVFIGCVAHEIAHQYGIHDLKGQPNGAYAVGDAAAAAAAKDPDCQ